VNIAGDVLIGLGVLLVLLSGIGLLRFPDTLTRANATTKAAGLGVACLFAGVAFAFATPEAAVKMTIAVLLQFTAAPIAGHVIGRAAYRSGTPLWPGTHLDELQGFRERAVEPVRDRPGNQSVVAPGSTTSDPPASRPAPPGEPGDDASGEARRPGR
jgi:multicomponent Na+:H+ antiporter subunit G